MNHPHLEPHPDPANQDPDATEPEEHDDIEAVPPEDDDDTQR